jgi:hypothetical protein
MKNLVFKLLLVLGFVAPLQASQRSPIDNKALDTITKLCCMRIGKATLGQDLNDEARYITTGAQYARYNCVIPKSGQLSLDTINQVHTVMGDLPYGWLVRSDQVNVIGRLQSFGFTTDMSKQELAMRLEIREARYPGLPVYELAPGATMPNHVTAVNLKNPSQDNLVSWVDISAKCSDINKKAVHLFMTFICRNVLVNECHEVVTFYSASENKNHASCMSIIHGDGTVTIHQFSSGGWLELELIKRVLDDAKKMGCTTAYLLSSSSSAQTFFREIGFKDDATYYFYVPTVQQLVDEQDQSDQELVEHDEPQEFQQPELVQQDEQAFQQQQDQPWYSWAKKSCQLL